MCYVKVLQKLLDVVLLCKHLAAVVVVIAVVGPLVQAEIVITIMREIETIVEEMVAVMADQELTEIVKESLN